MSAVDAGWFHKDLKDLGDGEGNSYNLAGRNGIRYPFDHGIVIDFYAKDGLFHVQQAGDKLGVEPTLLEAKKLALSKADFMKYEYMTGVMATRVFARFQAESKDGKHLERDLKDSLEAVASCFEHAAKAAHHGDIDNVFQELNRILLPLGSTFVSLGGDTNVVSTLSRELTKLHSSYSEKSP